MRGHGLVTNNPYDPCVLIKQGPDGAQIAVLMHVDERFITSTGNDNHMWLKTFMRDKYKEIKILTRKVVDHIGMTFDFIVPVQVSITMDNCERSILSECGVWPLRVTPAASTLFDTRDAPKAFYEEVQFFRTFVAKLLYLAKRVRPECLVTVSFLVTRVNSVDADGINKPKRLLGYLHATKFRGIVLRVGDNITARAFINASYGVHQSSEKPHIGCAIVEKTSTNGQSTCLGTHRPGFNSRRIFSRGPLFYNSSWRIWRKATLGCGIGGYGLQRARGHSSPI
jgi:hypothetical protein